MKKTNRILLMLLLTTALLLSACTLSQTSAQDLMKGVKSEKWPEPSASLDDSIHSPLMIFSWSIFRESLGDGGNMLISPASIYLALAMTMNGAKGDTLSAMKEALSSQNLSQEEINTACRDWISLLNRKTEKTRVSVADSIWFRKDYKVSEIFLKTNADYFDASQRALDFDSPDSVKVINNWVKEQTQGAIDRIVSEIRQDTMMYLINAVYFKSDWKTPFSSSETMNGNFISPAGQVQAKFMNRTGKMSFTDSGSAIGILLPYEDDRFSFFAVMPQKDQDLREYIKGLGDEELNVLIGSMEEGQVSLSIPKFEMKYENSLNDELTKLGMGVAFTDQADFSGISADGKSELSISDILHKTFCRVDEKGTEAAAVTKVEMRATGMPAAGIQIRFDRPFIFGILDNASNSPLFLGILENPGK